mgnify:CR=1 FL=1
MSKSRRFAIPGTTSGSKYVFSFNDQNQIESVKKQSQLGRPFLSVDPSSSEFQKVTSSSQALEAYNVNKHEGRKDLYKTSTDDIEIASNEQKNNKHATEKKKEANEDKDIDETGEKIDGVAAEVATATENRAETLRYPFDIDINQDHLKIVQYEYQRPSGDFVRGVQASRPASLPGPVVDGYREADSVKGKPFGKYTGGVLLPMPKVSDSNGAEWGKSDLNVFGLGFTSLAGGFLSAASGEDNTAFDDLRKSLGEDALKDTDDASQGNILRQNILGDKRSGIQNLDGVGFAGLAIGAQELSKFAGVNLSADEVLARTTGKILNPNAELLFQGPVLRDFGFKFLMIARSETEAEEIRKIVRFFKVGAAPVFSDGPALLGTPNIFQLEYKAGDRILDTVNKFNEMALRTITVDYAPDGFWSAYQDSHPVAVVLNLQFSELKPIYQKNHTQEAVDSVGY